MKWITRVIFASILSFGVAWMLSALPALEFSQNSKQGILSVFQLNRQIELSDLNLVDYVGRLPLRSDIDKVDWEQSILSIDLALGPTEEITQDEIMSDLYELSQFALFQMVNVDQVLLRVVLSGTDGQRDLLVAMDVSRRDCTAEDLDMLQRPGKWTDPEIRSKLHLTYTDHWLSGYKS